MKIKLLLLGWLLLSTGLLAQTLGQTVQRIHDESATIITQRETQADTWGEKTALEDLQALRHSAAALQQSLEGDDAKALITVQRDLASAASRVRASRILLPAAPSDAATLEEVLKLSQAVDQRLSQLRLRFAQKASRVPGTLSAQSLRSGDEHLAIYENPKALLIDVRDARQLASSLQTGRFPPLGFGLAQPNNLDPIQVQRFIQAGWALQRSLEGNFQDISQVHPLWEKFRFEYDRLGYAGSSNVTRQLERVMQRLGTFFEPR